MLTKLLGAIVGVMLLVGNAWAANDGNPQPYWWTMTASKLVGEEHSAVDGWIAAQKVCIRLGINTDICAMKNAPSERMALSVAQISLDLCDKDAARAGCEDSRAYIKQRWGY